MIFAVIKVPITSAMQMSLLFVLFLIINYARSDEVDFVPTAVIDGASNDSITISWISPGAETGYNYSYEVMRTEMGKRTEPPYSGITTNIFTIKTLEPGTNYQFRVRACVINYSAQCGDWSAEVEGQTTENYLF